MDKTSIVLNLIRLGNEKQIRLSRHRIQQVIKKSKFRDMFEWRESDSGEFSPEILRLLDRLERKGVIMPEIMEEDGQIKVMDYALKRRYAYIDEIKDELEPLVEEFKSDRPEIQDVILYLIKECNQQNRPISRYRIQNILYIADKIYEEMYYASGFKLHWYKTKYGVFSPLIYKMSRFLEEEEYVEPEIVMYKDGPRVVNFRLRKHPRMIDPRLQHVIHQAIEIFYDDKETANKYLKNIDNLEWYRRRSR